MPLTLQQKTLSAARRLHERGLWLIWLVNGKECCIDNWQNERQSIDLIESIIVSLPDIGIGIAWNRSPLVDLDCDDPDAEQNLEALCGGSLPHTPTFRSQRGLHRLYLRPLNMPEKASHKLAGIGEVRALCPSLGSQSAVPPTRGRSWLPGLSIFDMPPVPLPDPIAEKVRKEAANSKRRRVRGHVIGDRFTLLQFVLVRLLGAPVWDNGDGSACWVCPSCGQQKLRTLPHKPHRRDRFLCHFCAPNRTDDLRGDEFDGLRLFDPDPAVRGNYSVRRWKLEAWAREYEQLMSELADSP